VSAQTTNAHGLFHWAAASSQLHTVAGKSPLITDGLKAVAGCLSNTSGDERAFALPVAREGRTVDLETSETTDIARRCVMAIDSRMMPWELPGAVEDLIRTKNLYANQIADLNGQLRRLMAVNNALSDQALANGNALREIAALLGLDPFSPATTSASIITELRIKLAKVLPTFDSPLEEAFWARWQQLYRAIPLEPQHEVFGGRYRLDFAHLPTKTAIELDGFTYHRDANRFQRDRQRDRELTQGGWRVIRFASAELRDGLDRCIDQVVRIIRTK
jgi:very-short-patch-repair endonuclease